MSFHINHDFFDNPIVPPYILSKSNKERIGTIKCTQKRISVKFNSLDEGKASLIKRMEEKHAIHIVETAEKLGIGTTDYEVINID